MPFSLKEHIEKIRATMHPAQRAQVETQDEQIKSHTPVGRGGWLTIAKIIAGVALAFWNIRLFVHTIPGWRGWITGLMAASLEYTAFYCVTNFTRTVGFHKFLMGFWAIVLMGFSLVHATLSIIDFTGYTWPSPEALQFYSHAIAFGLLMFLLVVSVVSLEMGHWMGALMNQQARSTIEGLGDRACTLIDQTKMYNAAESAYLKAQLFESRTQLEEDLRPVFERRANLLQDRDALLDSLDDADIRKQLRGEIDQLLAGSPRPALPSSRTSVVPQPYVNGRSHP
jgi:hypothetical protein